MFVLHVGPHKTATTWMQTNLHFNAAALEKAGWLYPQVGERVVIAHHDLSDHPAEILDDGSRKSAAFRRIADKAAAAISISCCPPKASVNGGRSISNGCRRSWRRTRCGSSTRCAIRFR